MKYAARLFFVIEPIDYNFYRAFDDIILCIHFCFYFSLIVKAKVDQFAAKLSEIK